MTTPLSPSGLPRARPCVATVVAVAAALVLTAARVAAQEGGAADTATVRASPTGAFVIERSVVLPASPDSVWAVVTGDIGGCFCEIFDPSGDGVRHAVVTYADRGERLRFEGPLGFMGNALHLVTTYTLEARGDSTRLAVEIHGAGEVRDGWPEAISRVWRHFLEDRLAPYVAGRSGE